MLTCSHEIDIAQNLFGEVKEVFCSETLSNIDTDVENSVLLILHHKNKVKSNLIIDFSSKISKRKFKIFSKDQTIEWNFFEKKIKIFKNKKIIELKPKKNTNINNIYFYQNKKHLSDLKKKQTYQNNNFHTEKIIFSAIKSLKSKKIETVR